VPFVVFFFEVYSNVTTALVAISGYLISIGAAYTIYTATQRTGVQEKFLDYRALAEGMRVALFWRLAGLNSSPASYYLSKQQSELDWIRYAINTWELLARRSTTEQPLNRALETVRTCWFSDQMDYFGRKARANKRAADKLGACATFFFRLGFFVLTPAMLIIHGLKLGGEQLDPWMQVVTPAAFVIAGACDYYAERMLFSEHAKQYSRMHDIFRKSLNSFLEKAGE